jgi:hypothetical protein
MFMAMALYEDTCHGEIGSECIQQGEWLLVRILLGRNQAREVPNVRKCQISGIKIRETIRRR